MGGWSIYPLTLASHWLRAALEALATHPIQPWGTLSSALQRSLHRLGRHTLGGGPSVGGELETAPTATAETKRGPGRYDRDAGHISTDGRAKLEDVQTEPDL